MSEMLSRMVEAIERAKDGWGREYTRDESIDEARAALEAIRDHAPTLAMSESVANDDEGPFPSLGDLIDCSGENKTHTILRQAWVDGINFILAKPK